MVPALLGALGIVALTLGTAVFVAAEFGMVAADRTELELLARDGDRPARRALRALDRLSFQLSAAQLGITATTLAVGFLAEPSLTTLLEPALHGAGITGAAADTLAVAAALAIVTLVQMVVGELVPKNWAIARPTAVARRVATPMWLFTRGFAPVIGASNALANRAVRALGIEPQEELRSARSAAELESLVRSSAEAGTLPAGLARLLTRSLDFDRRTAGAVMTPRTRIVALAASAPVSELIETSRTSGHSRFPVLVEDGAPTVVHLKHAFTVAAAERAHTAVSTIAQPLPQVPEPLRLDPLLRRLRRSGLQMAAVIDEWGGLAGIVTLEDVAEELLGEISDEHEADGTATGTTAAGSATGGTGAVQVPGLLRIDEASAAAPGFSAPPGPYDTVAGLVLRRLGRLAEPGDTVRVDGWTITVERMDGRRIDLLTLREDDLREDDPS